MATHLLDKSAWSRLVRLRLEPWFSALDRGALALTGVGLLEVLYSAPNPAGYAVLRRELLGMPRVAITESIIDRAIDVQGEMVSRGTHRAPSPADFILAACAETNGLTVLHYDKDFDLIAEVTGQPMEWVTPAGSVS